MSVNKLLDAIENKSKLTTTENGAITNRSTDNTVLDFFSRAASMRENTLEAGELFDKAYSDNPCLALQALFWLRDVRGGQGERKLFRHILSKLAVSNPDLIKNLFPVIPVYGRWDDLIHSFKGTPVYKDSINFCIKQLADDAASVLINELGNKTSYSVSLCAKWMPSENAGKKSKLLTKDILNVTNLSAKKYRKLLSYVRNYLKIVETDMCANNWANINYSHVPSRASLIYRKAFNKHDKKRYSSYLDSVKKGESKINAGTLYPYEIIEKVLENPYKDDEALEQLWLNQHNYVTEDMSNSLVVVDTSSSMYGKPITVSIAVGLYIAERNKGLWHNKFITFASNPELITVKGVTLHDKVRNIYKAPWGGSTDLQAVFDLILKTALSNDLSVEDMPERIYIVSDMEFNIACPKNKKTNLEVIKSKYRDAGYPLPKLVFWNVAARNNQSPAKSYDEEVALFSGLSPSILKTVLCENLNPLQAMLDTIDTDRYKAVKDIVNSTSNLK